jgi:hypothetical protein
MNPDTEFRVNQAPEKGILVKWAPSGCVVITLLTWVLNGSFFL